MIKSFETILWNLECVRPWNGVNRFTNGGSNPNFLFAMTVPISSVRGAKNVAHGKTALFCFKSPLNVVQLGKQENPTTQIFGHRIKVRKIIH